MITVTINDHHKKLAALQKENIPAPRDIAMRDDRWLVGFIGELVFENHFKSAVRANKYLDHDFIYNGWLVDVKTQILTYPPRPSLHFDIPVKESHRRPDIYFLVTLIEDKSNTYGVGDIAYLVGYISAYGFYKESTLLTKDKIKQYGRGGSVERYTIKMSALRSVEEFKNIKIK